MCNVKLQLYAKGLAWSRGGGGGGEPPRKTLFYFLYVEFQKQSFQPIFLNRYLFNMKSLFEDNSRVEQTIFTTKKISFSLKLLSDHFNGQFFINPFKPNGIFQCYQLDHSIFCFKGCWVVVFIFIHILI